MIYQWYYLAGLCVYLRFYFYTAFLWNECSMTCSGFKFNGFEKETKSPKFDKIVMTYYTKAEISKNLTEWSNMWNYQVA